LSVCSGSTAGNLGVWEGDGRFDLRVAETPEEMEAFLAAKQTAGETARMTAGYCWPWSDPRPDGTLVDDVKVGGWSRPWNVRSDRSVGDAPGSPFWATDPRGFGQVGCVYTVYRQALAICRPCPGNACRAFDGGRRAEPPPDRRPAARGTGGRPPQPSRRRRSPAPCGCAGG